MIFHGEPPEAVRRGAGVVYGGGCEELQADIRRAAMSCGADAILVESFDRVKTGSNSSWSSDGYGKASQKHNDAWWTENGSAHTEDQVEVQARVYYIKYLPAAQVQVLPSAPPQAAPAPAPQPPVQQAAPPQAPSASSQQPVYIPAPQSQAPR